MKTAQKPLAALVTAFLVAASFAAGCGGSSDPAACPGFAAPDGRCLAYCADTDCVSGAFCLKTKDHPEGVCTPSCTSLQSNCGDGLVCGKADNGHNHCVASTEPVGGYGTSCPFGTECAEGYVCVGQKGDTASVCTKIDGCKADADCPVGMWCGDTPKAGAKKDDLDFSVTQRVCLKRGFCGPCETDFDCSNEVGAVCVPDKNGEKFCSKPCDPAKNSCVRGAECVDVGAGVNACRPIVGSCHVKDPVTCSPCRTNLDCGPQGVCRSGQSGFKQGLRYCSTPCGAKDGNGKPTCPVAPNGLETMCMDDTQLAWGGPFTPSTAPNTLYGHCYPPFTVDNSGEFGSGPPSLTGCQNAIRDGEEECDDGNSAGSDGCGSDCKVTSSCRFTAGEPNDDGSPTLMGSSGPVKEVPAGCKTWLVTGTLDAGDVDAFEYSLADGNYAFVSTYTGAVGKCDADLVVDVRTGKIDPAKQCSDLTTPSDCTTDGACGDCDDDNGIGGCNRALVVSTGSGKDSATKHIRLYAKDPSASGISYTLVFETLAADAQGPKNEPGFSCY